MGHDNVKDSGQLAREVEAATATLKDRVSELLASVPSGNYVRAMDAFRWFMARELPILNLNIQWRGFAPDYRNLVDAMDQIVGPKKKSDAPAQPEIGASGG